MNKNDRLLGVFIAITMIAMVVYLGWSLYEPAVVEPTPVIVTD